MNDTTEKMRVAIVGGLDAMTGVNIHNIEFIARMLSGGPVSITFCGRLNIEMLKPGESLAEFMKTTKAPVEFPWTCTIYSFFDAVVLGAYQETISDDGGHMTRHAEFFLLDPPQQVPGYGGAWRTGGYIGKG